jgi:lipoate-protein ligase A
LENALHVSEDKIQSKGIASVRSRVANLNEFIKDVSLNDFKSAFLNQLDKTEGVYRRHFSDKDIAQANKLRQEKYDLWEWNYGSSPPYTVEKTRRIEGFGRIELYLQIEKGRLLSFHSHGDYFGNEDISLLVSRLQGCRIEETDLKKALQGIDVGDFYRNLTNDAFLELILT